MFKPKSPLVKEHALVKRASQNEYSYGVGNTSNIQNLQNYNPDQNYQIDQNDKIMHLPQSPLQNKKTMSRKNKENGIERVAYRNFHH